MSEIHISRLPVTLLGNDSHTQSLCRVTAFAVGRNMQHSRSVKEYNDVRILFDCSAFAQVCQFRTTSGTVLRFTVQLAQQHDGDMQLLCQNFALRVACATSCSRFRLTCLVLMSQSCR